MHFSITAISLLSFTFGASTAAVLAPIEKRDITTGFFQLLVKPPNDPSAAGIPVILGAPYDNDADTYLSTGDPTETILCSEFAPVQDWDDVTQNGIKVINHPSVTQDVWAWKTIGAKFFYTSIWMDITGTRGNWSCVQDPNSSDMHLSLNGDTVAGYSSSYGLVYFGNDIPAGEDATPAVLVCEFVDSC